MIPFLPFEPDKGPYSATSSDSVLNVLAILNGWGPMPSLTSVSDSLGVQCRGAAWYRNTAGTYGFIAGTATRLFKLASNGSWDHVSKLAADQTVNGVFAADTDWTKGAGVTIAAGVSTWTAVASGVVGLLQSQSFTAGTLYKVTFTVSNFTAGAVFARFAGGTSVSGTSRTANGTYTEYLTAVTGNTQLRFIAVGTTSLNIDNVSVQAMTAYTLADGHYWQFEVFGSNLYATHLNDTLQVLNMDSGTTFADASGSPPQAKFIRTIGDFLFLAHLKVGADTFPRRWQHSQIDDPADWNITGDPGDSDRQDIPDGGDITGIIPMSGGARLLQESAKRFLQFTPGSAFSFQSTDIDATNGATSPYCIVSVTNSLYFYRNDDGFYLGDEHKPIGAERVDKYFLGDADPAKLGEVQGISDPARKMVWLRYTDQSGTNKMLGYNWQLDRWTRSDVAAELLVSAVTTGVVIDDITDIVDTVDIPMDSTAYQGGIKTFGAFTSSDELQTFAGDAAAFTVETTTTELTPDGGSFVQGAKLKGNVTDYTIQVGRATLPDGALTWSAPSIRSSRTGMCPFRSDGKYHRFRVNGTAGGSWTHLHGITPFFIQSGSA